MSGIVRFVSGAVALVSFLSTQTHAYTSRMEDRGYSSVPDEENVAYDTPTVEVVATTSVECEVDEDGFYGTFVDAGNQELIEFKYQLETKPDTQATVKDILPSLERAYLDTVLPILFASECSRRRGLYMRRTRNRDVIGATINPEDLDLEIPCEANNVDNECHQIDGKMTVYTDGGPSGLRETILNELRKSMDNGDFNNGIHDNLINVTYLEITTDGLQADNQNVEGSGTGAERRLRPPYYAIIAVGGVMIIVAGVVWSRRRKGADSASTLSDETSMLPSTSAVPAPSRTAANGSSKPEGDSTAIETTLDFSSIRVD